MFYDLNVPWTTNHLELQRTLNFLAELDYNVVALNHTISGKLPSDLTCAIPTPLPFPPPPRMRLLRRCTLTLSDPSQNHRLTTLSNAYDILALRPTTEKALLQACQNLDCALISLDLSVRYPFHFKAKTLMNAVARGVRIEIGYAAGVGPDAGDGGMARRNVIQNATAIIRATKGRGIVISSEAKRALACRGPWDVVNMACVWGLGQERGREALGREARAVVVRAETGRRAFRGVVDVVYGGEKPEIGGKGVAKQSGGKRKADVLEEGKRDGGGGGGEEKPISKREMKRRAKKAKLEAAAGGSAGDTNDANANANARTNTNGEERGNKDKGSVDTPTRGELPVPITASASAATASAAIKPTKPPAPTPVRKSESKSNKRQKK